MPTTPPESRTASSWASVRLRGWSTSDAAHAWVTTSGRCVISATSQNPRSLRCARSTRMPSSSQARTSARPASVSPRSSPTPWPNAFGRLQVIPIERSPSACSAGSSSSSASTASAPSMCMTATTSPPSSRSSGSRAIRSAPARSRSSSLRTPRNVWPTRVLVLDRQLGVLVLGVRREDREEAAGEPARAGALAVEVARVARVGERALLEQHVVVTVEDRYGHRDTVTWCSTSPVRSAAPWRSSASAGRSSSCARRSSASAASPSCSATSGSRATSCRRACRR